MTQKTSLIDRARTALNNLGIVVDSQPADGCDLSGQDRYNGNSWRVLFDLDSAAVERQRDFISGGNQLVVAVAREFAPAARELVEHTDIPALVWEF